MFGNLFFNRTLKQFIACKDLESSSGKALIEKIRSSAKDSLEKILEIIPQTKKPHSDILKEICRNEMNSGAEDRFLDNLQNDETNIRTATKNILGQSQQLNPGKLFKRLHESDDTSTTEIIDILDLQQQNLQPELFVKNALKMGKGYSDRLFAIAQANAERTNMSALSIDIKSLENPNIKIMLIRFLGAVNQPEAANMIFQFLSDKSKIIVIEALKKLKHMSVDYDPSPIARFIPDLREEDVATAFDILQAKSTAQTLPALTGLMTGKNEEFRNKATQVVIQHVDAQSLERFLFSLEKHEWWGKEQAINSLLDQGDKNLFSAAAGLVKHPNEFIRNSAEQLSASAATSSGDISGLSHSLFHDDWQVRERTIEKIGSSGNKSALELLSQVVDSKPESSIAVLKAVRKLGFSKGLEITSKCLQKKEAAIQREALMTTSKIVNQRHADNIRNAIVKMVPNLQATVRDTALEAINEITVKFNLPRLNLDEDNLFETRLIKIEKNRDKLVQQTQQSPAVTEETQAIEVEKTELVSFQHIEELKPGDYWLDRYRIDKEIGRGAMGRVMLVDDETVGERLILKFMHPELTADVKSRERFLRELKYARKISHKNVIRIHDFLVKDGISAISMEYFISEGLDHLIKKRLLKTPEQSLDILYQVSDGMWAAHEQDVIHRDLKPSNILVDENNYAKVVDFGIASATSENDVTLTKTGMIIGTPAYLSPERAKGLEADHRSDIYALGIIAYNMFNGGLPYKGEPISLLFQHIEGKATPLHRLDKGVSTGVSLLVQNMMAVDIEKRYQTMKDVRDAIKELL
ncbi:MAG: protein kinase [Gammaproteobacteria bacterium]|nr:protein kinase [Gammaproteobacteria bacterium]MBT4195805.1 protein kinase [Gammaproteobacteria bacterium]